MSENTAPTDLVQRVNTWAQAMADSTKLKLQMSTSGDLVAFDREDFTLYFHPSHWCEDLREAIMEGMRRDRPRASELCDRLESDYKLLHLEGTISGLIAFAEVGDADGVIATINELKAAFPGWRDVALDVAESSVRQQVQEWAVANPGEELTPDVIEKIVSGMRGDLKVMFIDARGASCLRTA